MSMPRADLLSRLRPKPHATETHLFCVSLKMLAVAASTTEGSEASQIIQTCYGLNRVSGYVVDAKNRDIILYGQRDEGYPPIYFADICTFVRNIWHKDRMRYIGHEYPAPCCSLDPSRGAMASVDRAMQDDSTSHFASARERDSVIDRLVNAIGPQEVRIHGVPRDARVAHVMIAADYHMKRVSQGHLSLPGVDSCMRTSLDHETFGEHPASRMSRFWFHLDRDHPTFLEADGIIEIEGCAMIVLTESQISASDGSLIDGGDADPVARAFAESLSNQLRNGAAGVREYRDLSNLYRLYVLFKAIQCQRADKAAGLDLNPFERCHSSAGELPSHLPALANIVGATEETQTGWYFLVCGGVSMDAIVSPSRFKQDQSGLGHGRRDTIIRNRPDARCAFWNA